MVESAPSPSKAAEQCWRPVVQGFASALRKERKEKGYIFGLGFTKTAYAETARLRLEEALDIELCEVQKIIDMEPLPELT